MRQDAHGNATFAAGIVVDIGMEDIAAFLPFVPINSMSMTEPLLMSPRVLNGP